MRRFSLAMVGIAMAALVTMVSCRKPNIGNGNTVASRTMTFNATTEMGTNKTSLDGLNVNWNAGDKLSINGESFTLSAGAGTTFASFTSDGEVSITAPYYAAYPESAGYTTAPSTLTFTLSETPTYNASTIDIPMVAVNYSELTTINFKNVVNVLKLQLTGDGSVSAEARTLTSIVLKSTTSNLNGHVAVTFSGDTPNVGTAANGTNTTTLSFGDDGLQLTSGETTNVYIVLPKIAGGDLWVKLNCKNEKYMEKGITVTSEFNAVNNMLTAPALAVNATTDSWTATVVTIPVCAVHATCASSGGVVRGTGVDEQGVCWGTGANPTIAGSHYVHNYEYATGSLTPKNTTTDNTFTGFMSGLNPGETYHVRAYIRRGSEVIYGNEVTFTTLASEPTIEYVNLGLPSGRLWATCNLGAANEYDYGDYYQWGDLAACSTILSETTCYVDCNLPSYRFAAKSYEKFTKYCPSAMTEHWYNYSAVTNEPDGKENLGASGDHYNYADDCVRQTLGGDWRMPTIGDWGELYNNTTNEWTTVGGVSGRRFTGKGDYTGVSIFLPAASNRTGTSLYGVGSTGFYWSRSLYSSNPVFALSVYFHSGGVDPYHYNHRCYGLTVRPVR